MGEHTSPTESFEEVLKHGRTALSTARDEYDTLEQTETVPSGLVEAISDLERELDELDQVLNVDDTDLEQAQQTVQRIELLDGVFSALRERQRTVVEGDVSRIEYHLAGLAALLREHGDEGEVQGELDNIESKQRMLNTLISKDRHEKVVTNDRVSTEKVDTSIRELDADLEPHVPDSSRVETYTAITGNLLDEIHDALASLGNDNDDRTAYATELKSIKKQRSQLEDEDGGGDAETAQTMLEETLRLHHSIVRSQADQRVAERLADAVAEFGSSVECDVDRCVSSGDPETLLRAITDAIGREVQRSTIERLQQLLEEHDGSVLRTAQATDFDVPTILEHLEQLHADGAIADLEVSFD